MPWKLYLFRLAYTIDGSAGNFGDRLEKIVTLRAEVADSLLSYGRARYPNEGILLLRGRCEQEKILVNDLVIPPLAIDGHGFSSFPLYMLPTDLSIIGTAHSHPSGILEPSTYDLNHFYGMIMIIIAYPYRSTSNLRAFNREGYAMRLEVTR